MNQYSRVYAGKNEPTTMANPIQGIFKKKTFIEKLAKDNPTGLVIGSIAIGVGLALVGSKMMNKKKRK